METKKTELNIFEYPLSFSVLCVNCNLSLLPGFTPLNQHCCDVIRIFMLKLVDLGGGRLSERGRSSKFRVSEGALIRINTIYRISLV